MLSASWAALGGTPTAALLPALTVLAQRAPFAAAALSGAQEALARRGTSPSAGCAAGGPPLALPAPPYAAAAGAPNPDIFSLVQPRRRQQRGLTQPISGTRQYRTVNHDASEALEHALEPWTPRPDPHRLMQAPPQPPAAEVLHALGCRHGVVDFQEYIRVVQKLSCERQYSLLSNCDGVATHLQALGIPAPLVGRMLQHCPALFSYPAADRATPLLDALMGASVGLGPTQAAEVFVRCPALGNTRNVMPAIVRLVVEQQALSWHAGSAPEPAASRA